MLLSQKQVGLENKAEFDMAINVGAKAFTALSASLYKDGFRSIMRELVCNGIDACRKIGVTEPVVVNIPENIETNEPFFVQDFGVGMSLETIFEIFAIYFNSAKEGDLEQIGGFGLGGKTPFLYTDSFTIETTSPEDGIRRTFIFNNKAGMPAFNYLENLDIENSKVKGTKVSFLLKSHMDIAKFYDALDELIFAQYPIKVVALGKQNLIEEFMTDGEFFKQIKNDLLKTNISFVSKGLRVAEKSKYVSGSIFENANAVDVNVVLSDIAYPYKIKQISAESKELAKEFFFLNKLKHYLKSKNLFAEDCRYVKHIFLYNNENGTIELNVSRESVRTTEENEFKINSMLKFALLEKKNAEFEEIVAEIEKADVSNFKKLFNLLLLKWELEIQVSRKVSDKFGDRFLNELSPLLDLIKNKTKEKEQELAQVQMPEFMFNSKVKTSLVNLFSLDGLDASSRTGLGSLSNEISKFNDKYENLAKTGAVKVGNFSMLELMKWLELRYFNYACYTDTEKRSISNFIENALFVREEIKNTVLSKTVAEFKLKNCFSKTERPFVFFVNNPTSIKIEEKEAEEVFEKKGQKKIDFIYKTDWDKEDRIINFINSSFEEVVKHLKKNTYKKNELYVPESYAFYFNKYENSYQKKYESLIINNLLSKRIVNDYQIFEESCVHREIISRYDLVVVSDSVYEKLVEQKFIEKNVLEKIFKDSLNFYYFSLKKLMNEKYNFATSFNSHELEEVLCVFNLKKTKVIDLLAEKYEFYYKDLCKIEEFISYIEENFADYLEQTYAKCLEDQFNATAFCLKEFLIMLFELKDNEKALSKKFNYKNAVSNFFTSGRTWFADFHTYKNYFLNWKDVVENNYIKFKVEEKIIQDLSNKYSKELELYKHVYMPFILENKDVLLAKNG